MPPEGKMERVSAAAARNFAVIRATPAQTTLLRASYAHSNVASREQLAEISEQTGLPQKWIHQWFGRQRSKDRRGRPNSKPGAVSNRSGSPSSTYSQDSIIKIKSESIDPGASLSSSGTPSGSEYLGTVSASSSMVIEEHRGLPAATPSAIGQSAKKKRKDIKPQTDNVSTANTRTLRSKTRKGPAVQSTLVKKELVEEALLDNFTGAQPPSGQSAGGSRKMNGTGQSQAKIGRFAPRPTPTVHHLNQALLPMIAPAKRSPITPSNLQKGTSAVKAPSRLSIDQSNSIYAHPSGVQAQAQRDEGRASDIIAQEWSSNTRKAVPYHYDKPVFHTRFQNNGPSDFGNGNVHGSTTSKMEFSLPRVLDSYNENGAEVRRPVPFPLAPAFDWCSPVPFGSNARDSKGGILTSSPDIPENAKPLRFRFGKTGPSPVEVGIDQVVTELDPSVAPQKHLLDILGEHRDENGTYTLDEGLVGALLGDVPPFHRAMGLSFLSKLGLEWAQESVM